ncbi:hypothetical protein TcasGA2_TC001971 [Tribolium castaneum]|uniref:Uncharacterized protein n=1 Tax=Tribolium castaneum TaxID=7070 RepID=D7EK57_TRICA|nr:PREDICTED: uncharacterized protein LOC103312305 [Tribolium castaneum]EFA13006.1 hypothetical protein TcasGA2_TC001971 [Tribolium castaneum]|eukprot:XP_008190851.1 PREDICTED: uncharacterized protein LOC103312305 [Tribolium castaneum]
MVLTKRTLAFATLVLISSVATSPTENPTKKDDRTEVAGLNWSFYKFAAISAVVLVAGVGFAGLLSLLLLPFTHNVCFLLGTCDTLDVWEQFSLPRKVNKRSIEYLEPMITTLANAYEKYADKDVKKKSRKLRS